VDLYAREYYPPDEYETYIPEEQIEYYPQQRREPATAKKRARRKKRHVKRIAVRFRKRIDEGIRIPAEAYIIILIIFAGMAGMVYSQAATQGARVRLATLKSRLAEVQTMNAALYTELYENFDKEAVERIAIEKLNMHPRKPHQEVRVNVPKASYVVQNKPNAASNVKLSFFEGIFNIFK